MSRVRRALGGLVALAPFAAGCSAGTTTVYTDGGQAAPAGGTYTLVFPALSVAVYAQTVQVFVFPEGDAVSQCRELIEEQPLGTLPTPAVPSQSVAMCDLATDGGARSLAIGFGSYAVLAVAQRGGTDVAIGCAEQTVSAAAPSVTVTLEQRVVPPQTTCPTLSDACMGECAK